MAIISISYPTTGLADATPQLLYIKTDDTLATVTTAGYLNQAKPIYGNIFNNAQMAIVYTTNSASVLLTLTVSNSGIITLSSTGGGSGDVNGPASATDNALVRFNGTSGKSIQNSAATLDDSGVLTGVSAINNLSGLTASTALIANSSKNITSSITTDVELSYVHGVTSSIQTQLDSKASFPATASSNQMLQSNGASAPTWSTATWPATTTANRLLYSSATNTVSELTTTSGAALTATSAGVLTWRAMINGQVIIGSTSGSPQARNLTAANGTVITNGSSSITIGLPIAIPGRNLIFNGGFNVWQRGTSISPGYYLYGPDRWQVGNNDDATSEFTQVADATTGSYLLRMQRVAGASITNPIVAATSLTNNMCVKARGNVLTLSFVASAGLSFSAASGLMNVQLVSGTGTDVSFLTTGFTGQANLINTTQVVSPTPARYTFTTSTLATDITQLGVQLGWTPTGTAGSSDYLQISEVQLEISASASNFEVVPYAQELQRCQYFYQILSGMTGYAANGGTTDIQCGVSYQNAMRAIPTVGATNLLVFTDSSANYTQSSVLILNYMDSGYGGLLQLSNFTGLTGLRPMASNFAVNGGRLTFDAELY